MEPFIGMMVQFGGNFAPRGWALCDGQLLPINSNSALFSILGTTFGGDGKKTFRLPDLRGRFPMHPGAGPDLSPRKLGQGGGVESVTLTTEHMPAHQHEVRATSQSANTGDPANAHFAKFAANAYATGVRGNVKMDPDTITPTGKGQAVGTLSPFRCVNFIIALTGIFPSRN